MKYMKTNSDNINNSKSSKTKSIIALTSLIIVLSIVNITLLTGTIFGINLNTTTNANALSYSTSEDISFTFAPTLSIGLSTNSLTIDNLVPGTTSDSNVVSVTVSSNTPYGYVLSAGVGSTVSTDPYYNTSDLVHDNSTTQVPTTNKFSSIATSASLSSLTTDNTWGYSTSADGGTSWSTYSGLSNTTTKPLLDISDPATPSTIDFKIAARSATTQASGTYNNVITFYAVGKPEPKYLYEEIAKMSKGVQTTEDFQAAITVPTSRDYREDTSNSGVYEYNSAIFGESSDASNANKIYYYRGMLEPKEDKGSAGSDGKATTYPNYIKLDNETCWRIVRTTGSGGVKIIFNGIWTGATCANMGSDTQIGVSTFNGDYSTNRQAVRAGYTYRNTYASNNTTNRTLSALFGTNTTDYNTSDSSIKTVVDNWYSNNLNAYTSALESNADYCSDRSVYSGQNKLQPESLSIPQYTTDSNRYNFGAKARYSMQSASLTCGKGSYDGIVVDRSKVDVYSVVGDPDGNNRLKYPISLLTADEARLAGPTGSIGNSYLKPGGGNVGNFWLLSPSYIYYGTVYIHMISWDGRLVEDLVNFSRGVRPVISLKPGITATSGSGTATDPWIIPAP